MATTSQKTQNSIEAVRESHKTLDCRKVGVGRGRKNKAKERLGVLKVTTLSLHFFALYFWGSLCKVDCEFHRVTLVVHRQRFDCNASFKTVGQPQLICGGLCSICRGLFFS